MPASATTLSSNWRWLLPALLFALLFSWLTGLKNLLGIQTDSAGFYQFTGLTPGDYSVGFTAMDGYILTVPDAGSHLRHPVCHQHP